MILTSQTLKQFIQKDYITASSLINDDLIQPASLDLRLGNIAYRVAASCLPNKITDIHDTINALKMHEIDLTSGGVLERGCVYIIPLQEALHLPNHISGKANPKSSTGRLDVFARVITNESAVFDDIPAGFKGDLFVEISPRTFSILARSGDRLTQLRLMDLNRKTSEPLKEMSFTLDVSGDCAKQLPELKDFPPIIGWRARKHAGLIDLSNIAHYPILDYWEPVFARKQGGVILDPDDFYIFATKETIEIPNDYAAEMQAYDISLGEFRVHYAGFFDPGFGVHEKQPSTHGVLEIRTHEVPFLIDSNQVIGKLVFEKMETIPDKIYGANLGSHYQGQGLQLAKQFARNI